MSERFQDRVYDEENEIESIRTPRDILSNVAEENLKSRAERKAIKKYKEIIAQINSHISMKKYLISRAPLDINAIRNLEINILKMDKILSALEETEILTEIYKRETKTPKVSNSFSDVVSFKMLFYGIPISLLFMIGLLSLWFSSVENLFAVLLFSIFFAIPIFPFGFLILFFLLQWIIGKEKMNQYGTFITIILLVILAITCVILSAMVVC